MEALFSFFSIGPQSFRLLPADPHPEVSSDDLISPSPLLEEVARGRNPRRHSMRGHTGSTVHLSGMSSRVLFLSFILANTGMMAFEAFFIDDIFIRRVSQGVQLTLALGFSAEMAFRAVEAGGMLSLLSGQEAYWNVFDAILTAIGIVDIFLDVIIIEWRKSNISHGLQVMRVFRVVSVLRSFKLTDYVAEVDYVLVTAARQMMNFAFIVFVTLIVVGIWATNLLWDFPEQNIADSYSSLSVSMWTLFKLMTMDAWTQHVDQILDVYPSLQAFFLVFMFLSVSAVSIVPAIFLEVQIVAREKEKLFQKEAKRIARTASQELQLQRSTSSGLQTVSAPVMAMSRQRSETDKFMQDLSDSSDSSCDSCRGGWLRETSEPGPPGKAWKELAKLRMEIREVREAQTELAAMVMEIRQAVLRGSDALHVRNEQPEAETGAGTAVTIVASSLSRVRADSCPPARGSDLPLRHLRRSKTLEDDAGSRARARESGREGESDRGRRAIG